MKTNRNNEIFAPDHIILPKTHTSMYLMHKYWARKPYNIVSSYIKKYSNLGDIVLDPFCGSGVTVAESLLLGRKAVGIDLNPFSIFLTKCLISSANLSLFQRAFDRMKPLIEEKIDQFYGVNCPYCNNRGNITQSIWINQSKENQKKPDEKLDEIRIKCSHCGFRNKIIREADYPSFYQDERRRIAKIHKEFHHILIQYGLTLPEIPLMYENTQEKFRQIRHYLIEKPTYRELFTERNLIVLALIKDVIDNLTLPECDESEMEKITDLLLVTFTANLGQSSKMVWVISNRKGTKLEKREVGSWTHHFYWNPTTFFEVNPWRGFKTRFKKTLKAKKDYLERKDSNSLQTNFAEKSAELSRENKTTLLSNRDSRKLPLPDNSVDYIFADPPYGDSVQYYELSRLWNGWLGLSTNTQALQEIIVNPKQDKDEKTYEQNLESVFQECYRVLKDKRVMTITFHNTDINIRNTLILAAIHAGFHLKGSVFQMPPRRSLKAYLHYEKTPTGDYFLKFLKDTSEKRKPVPDTVQKERLHTIINNCIYEALIKRGEPTPSALIYNFIDQKLIDSGLFPLQNPKTISQVIEKIQQSDKFTYDDKTTDWWLNGGTLPDVEVSLVERINKFLAQQCVEKSSNYQEKEVLKTKSDYYNLIYSQFNGILTPDRQKITKIIEKYRNL